jgi:CheY-like chemotaxis protein
MLTSINKINTNKYFHLRENFMGQDYKKYMQEVRQVMLPFEDLYAPYIAVIDDSMHDRAVLRNFVRAYHNDIPVRTFRSGAHFWESMIETSFPIELKAHPIRAIFLDLNMSEMCGRETLGKIREIASFSNTPVYMMSRKAEEEDVPQLLEMGANDFIRKPFDYLALSLLIQKGSFSSAVKRQIA